MVNLNDLNELTEQSSNSKTKAWINSNLNNYILKMNKLNKSTKYSLSDCEHIIHWLDSDQSPVNMDGCTISDAYRLSKEWIDFLKIKGNNIFENETDTRVEIDFKDGFKLVELVSDRSYEREGNLMGHCVGGSIYKNGNMKIFSLRDSKNNPHCTIEHNGDINQIKGKGNGEIHPKYIEYIIKTLEYFGKEVRSSEMSNLGYTLESDEVLEYISKFCDGERFINFQGKKYLYKRSKLSLKHEFKTQLDSLL